MSSWFYVVCRRCGFYYPEDHYAKCPKCGQKN